MLAANPIFSIALKSCLHPLSYYDKPLSHCANGHSSHFCDHYNSISTQFFTTASVKTLLSLIRLSSSLVDTWSLVYHLIAKVVLNSWFLSITWPWSRIWIYFTVESLGIKVIGLVLIYENCVMDLVILFFILALNYHLIITWRNFDCMVLRLWNTNTYNMHQMHRQVYKVW